MDKNRRGFMAWLAGFFGLGIVGSPAIAVVPKKSKGFVCLYLNVGHLPPFKAEAYIDRIKDKWRKEDTRKIFEDWGMVVIPVRPPQETRVALFDFEHGVAGQDDLDQFAEANRLLRDDTPFEFPDKMLVIDHVRLMLGAPVCKVELDATQLEAAYDQTRELFERVGKSKGLGAVNRDGMGQEVFKNIMVTRASIMLGHIRRKWEHNQMDGDDLVEEGNSNLIYWTQYLDAI